jgi:hydroxymethylglutaryl-CoA reductase (NADPH)
MDDYLEKLKKGTLKLHALDQELAPEDAVAVRRSFVEQETDTSLTSLGSFTISIDRVVKRNCENMIGAVQIPVGVAGPLRVMGEYADGDFYVPIATTEGALVASVNRGCRAITRAGGAEVRILRDGMTRAPVFEARSVAHAIEVIQWVEQHEEALREAAESTTSHGKMLGITPYIAGTSVFLRIEYDTKDAMGMNMVTIASERVAEMVETQTGARLMALSGNMCTDKKPAAINTIMGRGKTLAAGVFLSDAMIKEILKTDAATLVNVGYRKNFVGSARAASLGFNAHAANIIAAIFLACGQDPAHVVEGSTTMTTLDPVEGGVYASVTIPSLQIGTVGGGTGIDTQVECLRIMGVAGGGDPPGSHARKFGEIIAATVLAGELSLLGAIAAGHLARAHKDLGRG